MPISAIGCDDIYQGAGQQGGAATRHGQPQRPKCAEQQVSQQFKYLPGFQAAKRRGHTAWPAAPKCGAPPRWLQTPRQRLAHHATLGDTYNQCWRSSQQSSLNRLQTADCTKRSAIAYRQPPHLAEVHEVAQALHDCVGGARVQAIADFIAEEGRLGAADLKGDTYFSCIATRLVDSHVFLHVAMLLH